MSYLTAKTFKNNSLYLAIFLPILLVGQVTTTISAHGAELEIIRIDDGSRILQENMGMSGSEIESFRLDMREKRVGLEDELNQINRPSLFSELKSHQIDTMNLGTRLELSLPDRIRLSSQVKNVQMESEKIGIRMDESTPLVPGKLLETQWIMLDPPLRTEEITFYDIATGATVTRNWGALKNDEKIRLLSNTLDEVAINSLDSEAKVSVLGFGSTTGTAGRYKVVMDSISYITQDVVNEKGKNYAEARVGVGLRVVADVTTYKANIDLNGLPALAAAVKAKKLAGKMTITNIGIVPKLDSGAMISTLTINEDSVLNTITKLAVLKSKMKNETTHLDPQVVWVKLIPYENEPPVQPKRPRWPFFGTKR